MKKTPFYLLLSVCATTLLGCQPSSENTSPTMENVVILSDFAMNYSYNNPYGDYTYDHYWPTLWISNESNATAWIKFSYSFYVFDMRQEDQSLNRIVYYLAPEGDSEWEMPANYVMWVPSNYRYGNNIVDVGDIDFVWTVLAVFEYY